MTAEIISTGTELLMGQIVDTNAAWLSAQLPELGIDLYFRSTVGDNSIRLKDALVRAMRRSDIVFTIGGLGPTPDDITKECVAELLGQDLVMCEAAADRLRGYFAAIGREMTENNLKQALLPREGCGEMMYNPTGTAPGYAFRGCFEGRDKAVIVMPGPPKEFIPMFEQSVKPYLLREFLPEKPLISAMLHIYGVGESAVASQLGDRVKRAEPSMATYVGRGDVLLRISARNAGLLEAGIREVREIFGDGVVSEDDSSMEETVIRLACEKKVTLSCAESCTGGLVGKLLTDVPGSSEPFMGGIISYSNLVKQTVLGVKADTLAQKGAVSPETACQMAEGAKRLTGSDIAVALTGVAGPGGGTPEKPVGLVYMGVAFKDRVKSEKLMLTGTRESIRLRSAMAALNEMRMLMIKEF